MFWLGSRVIHREMLQAARVMIASEGGGEVHWRTHEHTRVHAHKYNLKMKEKDLLRGRKSSEERERKRMDRRF